MNMPLAQVDASPPVLPMPRHDPEPLKLRLPDRGIRSLDALSLQFVIASRTAKGPVLDFACGDGLVAAAALARGAHVCALDADEVAIGHLLNRVPSQQHRRLRARVGPLLGADFKDVQFVAIHAGRVLHELDGDGVEALLQKFFQWLRPEGRLYISALTPTGPLWRPLQREIACRSAEGSRWPGYIEDVSRYTGDEADAMPMHLFDEHTLRRELEAARFVIEEMHCYSLPWDPTQTCCAAIAKCAP